MPGEKPRWLITVAVALISQGPLLQGQHVEARAGDVYYADKLGELHRMTGNGMNSDPALSLDGKSIIFVRGTLIPADFDEPAQVHPVRTQIWLLSVSGSGDPKLIFAGPVGIGGSEYVTFYEPKLAPDNQHAYFLIRYDATQFGLVRLDLSSGHTVMISGALDWDLIGGGEYAGDLVVQKRKPVGDGITTYFWLIDPDGKELGLVGETEKQALEFLKNPNRALP